MTDIMKDVLETKKINSSEKYHINYDYYERIYFKSNEDCHHIISKLDICGKNVLTVLGSGDQAIEFYRNGAKSIDLFDINKLTIYYFYLRLWCMKYFNCAYPDIMFDNVFLKKLLKYVKPSNESENKAYDYWTMMSNSNMDCYSNLFYQDYNHHTGIDDDVSDVRDMIDNIDFNFYNIDLTKINKFDKLYDLVYTSNIGDYLKERDFDCFWNNVYSCLNRNGNAVSTSFYGGVENGLNNKYMKKYFKKPKTIDVESSFNSFIYTKRMFKKI